MGNAKMDLVAVVGKIDETLKNNPMPKRVREGLAGIKEELSKKNQDAAIKITSAIYALDEIANDVNIPMHTKTILWDIISDLESLKGE